MNLLTDEVFRVVKEDNNVRLSLPALLEALGKDGIETMTGLQRHQADIFHMFICYLAGSVLAHAGRNDPRQSSDFWLAGLRSLAGRSDDSAWELVVEDPTIPAFMQPPALTKAMFAADYRPKAETPDGLDVLQTAKNHDLKGARAGDGEAEVWILALITCQTASGFLGQGNYGIARMNGGFGSRVCFSWQKDRRMGGRFQRDVRILLTYRKTLLASPYPYTENGLTCLWLEPWDGNTSLPLSRLDPFFIEVARRIRLQSQGRIIALGATSKTARIAAKEVKGNLGDPWTPVKVSDSAALTPSKNGLHPKLLRDLVFQDDFRLTPMQVPGPEESSGWFCGSVFVRGQGTTDGFHEAAVRVPARARPFLFGSGTGKERFTELSKVGLDMASAIQNKCLRPAIYALMEGGPEAVDFGKREISAWVDSQARSFHNGWQSYYFDWLWSTLDADDDSSALRPWFQSLKDLARGVMEKTFRGAPFRHGRGYKAKSKAERIFTAGLYKNFPDFMEERK